MKIGNIYSKFAVIFFSLGILSYAHSNEITSLVDGKILFNKPSQVLMWEDIPQFDNYSDKNDFLNQKYVLRSIYKNSIDIKKLRPNQLSDKLKNLLLEKNEFENHDLISLLSPGEMVLSQYYPMTDLLESLILLEIDNTPVGETFFSASSDGLLAAGTFVYSANVIVEDGILNLHLIYYDLDYHIAENSDLFKFSEKDKEYYWKAKESKLQLYNKITSNSGDNALEKLVNLTEYWNQIINSLNFDVQ